MLALELSTGEPSSSGKSATREQIPLREHVRVLDHKPPTSQRHRQLTKQHPNAFRTAAPSCVLQELCIGQFGPPDWVEAPSSVSRVHHPVGGMANHKPPAPCAPEHRDQTDICVGGDSLILLLGVATFVPSNCPKPKAEPADLAELARRQTLPLHTIQSILRTVCLG